MMGWRRKLSVLEGLSPDQCCESLGQHFSAATMHCSHDEPNMLTIQYLGTE